MINKSIKLIVLTLVVFSGFSIHGAAALGNEGRASSQGPITIRRKGYSSKNSIHMAKIAAKNICGGKGFRELFQKVTPIANQWECKLVFECFEN